MGDIHRLLHNRTAVRHPRRHRIRPVPERTRRYGRGSGPRIVPSYDGKRYLGHPAGPHPDRLGVLDRFSRGDRDQEGPEVHRLRGLRVSVRACSPDIRPGFRIIPGRGMGMVKVRVKAEFDPVLTFGKKSRLQVF